MLSKTYSYGLNGLDAYPICIEVDVSRGLPITSIVGLPDNAVRESRVRVRSAILNSGYNFPPRRVTVNLSPADVKKEGPSFDLAIALGVLCAFEQIDLATIQEYILLGELSLDGNIQPVTGSLCVALSAVKSRFKHIILPEANASEAAVVNGINVYPVKTLNEAVHILSSPGGIEPFKLDAKQLFNQSSHYALDFADVKGQAHVKRGLEIAAAGSHNVLLIGPPGSGKSMLAKRLPSILPEMTMDESLETTKIHSAMGYLKADQGLIATRPFRSPHHTTSDVAIVGGGSNPRAGEVTLSHNGILFLDELPEFNRNVLESLRLPLEDHCVTVARASKSVCFPSKFMLVCAMNPCPCGRLTEPKKKCQCTSKQIQKYMARISGPLLDRIDIHLEVPSLPSDDLLTHKETEKSETIKERTVKARSIQKNRFEKTDIFANAFMSHRQIKRYCVLNEDGKALIKTAVEQLGLSARAYDKILKVARTIADLEECDNIEPQHISEAIQYRSLDRGIWG